MMVLKSCFWWMLSSWILPIETKDTFWKVLKDMTTSLEVEVDKDTRQDKNVEGQSYGEIALV
jgi:hypothetical protein